MNEFLTNPNIDKILKTIADTMGLSVDFVKSNAMEYVLQYGKYDLINNVGNTFSLIGGIALIIALVSQLVVKCDYTSTESDIKSLNKFTKWLCIITICILVSVIGFEVLKYCVSPQIYSIKAVMELIKQ